FPTTEGETSHAMFQRLCWEGFQKRYGVVQGRGANSPPLLRGELEGGCSDSHQSNPLPASPFIRGRNSSDEPIANPTAAKRLEQEMEVIQELGFVEYFL